MKQNSRILGLILHEMPRSSHSREPIVVQPLPSPGLRRYSRVSVGQGGPPSKLRVAAFAFLPGQE